MCWEGSTLSFLKEAFSLQIDIIWPECHPTASLQLGLEGNEWHFAFPVAPPPPHLQWNSYLKWSKLITNKSKLTNNCRVGNVNDIASWCKYTSCKKIPPPTLDQTLSVENTWLHPNRNNRGQAQPWLRWAVTQTGPKHLTSAQARLSLRFHFCRLTDSFPCVTGESWWEERPRWDGCKCNAIRR